MRHCDYDAIHSYINLFLFSRFRNIFHLAMHWCLCSCWFTYPYIWCATTRIKYQYANWNLFVSLSFYLFFSFLLFLMLLPYSKYDINVPYPTSFLINLRKFFYYIISSRVFKIPKMIILPCHTFIIKFPC